MQRRQGGFGEVNAEVNTAGSADHKFLQTIITRMDGNSDIFKRILDDDDFRELLGDYYVKKVYEQLREAA